MAQRVTIRDIAAAAHTSITAVSLTLNNRPNRLSSSTKKHIRDVAKKLHYVPNQSARNLVNHRSMLLGLIVPDIENAYFASLAKHIGDECAVHGYALIIANSSDSAVTEKQLIEQFSTRGLDGILLVASMESFNKPSTFRKTIENIDMPVMLLDRVSRFPWCDGAGFDNFLGGALVAEYLLKNGHRNIGLISAWPQYVHKSGRIDGFLSTLKAAGHPVPKRNIVEGNFRYESGYSAVDTLLAQHVTAIFCGNDLAALGARKRIMEHGLRIPTDISIVGYDNSMATQGIGADLTTVNQDLTPLATFGVTTILDRIQEELADRSPSAHQSGKKWLSDPLQKTFSPQLVERSTVSQCAVNF